MIYTYIPENFNPKFEVSSCFLEKDGKFLLLNRQDHKPQANTWGAPAGKVSVGENAEDAIVREIQEEIGYEIKDGESKHLHKLYVRYDDYDFIYDIYRIVLNDEIQITINPEEHKEYMWVTPSESLSMNLIQDMDACIKLVYNLE